MTSQAQQIRDLKAQLEQLQAELATAAGREARVRDYFYPWPGHPDGDHFGVTARTRDGNAWALLLELGLGHTHVWTGDAWAKRGDLPHDEVYRWTRADTEKLGPELAEQSAKEHPAAEPGAAERAVADQLDDIIRKSRMAVEAFIAEPYEQIIARLVAA